MESQVQKICSCLGVLVYGSKGDSPLRINKLTTREEVLFYELKKNAHSTFHKIEKYEELKLAVQQNIHLCFDDKCESCDHLRFLQLCLVLLKLLNTALITEKTEGLDGQNSKHSQTASAAKGLLSISQQQIVRKSLQFLVALGILPNLICGIGIPLSKRIRNYSVFDCFSFDATPYQKHMQLVTCIETLLSCLECDALQSIILTYHGGDILASLFQLCHAPIKKISKTETDSGIPIKLERRNFTVQLALIKDNSPYEDWQIVEDMLDDRTHFIPQFDNFLQKMCPSSLMWELLLFQRIPLTSDYSEDSRVPVWLDKICNMMWTDRILQNYGVVLFVRGVLDKANDVDIQSGNVSNERLAAVARLITYNHVRHMSVKDYIKKLSKQVLKLLHVTGSQMDLILSFVASCIILQFCERELKYAEEYFLDVLFKPLWLCVRDPGSSSENVIVQEHEMRLCIHALHKIFCVSSSPLSRKHLKLIYPFFHCLCQMYFILLRGVSFLRSELKELILTILGCASKEDAVSLFQSVTFSSNVRFPVYLTKVSFVAGEEEGIIAVKKTDDEFSNIVTDCDAILDLLSEMKNEDSKDIIRSYLLLILKEFCFFHIEAKHSVIDEKKFCLLLTLLQKVSEWNTDISKALMSNISEVIEVVVMLLESLSDPENDSTFTNEKIMMIVLILNYMFSTDNKLSSCDWSLLKNCLPSLKLLQNCNIDPCIKEMLADMFTRIATHGSVCKSGSFTDAVENILSNNSSPSNAAQFSKIQKEDDSKRTDDMLSSDTGACSLEIQDTEAHYTFGDSIDGATCSEEPSAFAKFHNQGEQIHYVIDESISNSATEGFVAGANQSSETQSHNEFSLFEMAVKDASDLAVPVKGHGLINLGKLLKKRDTEAVSNKKLLLKIFEESLGNEDSFVYLPAIQGLSLLADVDAEFVLPIVLDRFRNEKKCAIVLKIGEVLIKICRLLGELVHNYREQLLYTFLVGAKHEHPQIRSSSLSNLGEACMYLKFNIAGHWLQEILLCVRPLLQTDEDLEVRRCAVMVITLLLRGIGKDMLQILEYEIRSLYKQLKIVYNTGNDDVLRLHSQLALEEINVIMKELFSSNLPLSKEIRIL